MRTLLALTLILLAIGCKSETPAEAPKTTDTPAVETAEKEALPYGPHDNLVERAQGHLLSPNLITAGQPSKADFETLKENGLEVVIDLRTSGEHPFDEKQHVEGLGLKYISIPVEGAAGLTQDNVEKLHRELDNHENQNVLLHCGSSNRVGAMMALRSKWLQANPEAESLELGKKAGLSKLEPKVQELLKQEPMP